MTVDEFNAHHQEHQEAIKGSLHGAVNSAKDVTVQHVSNNKELLLEILFKLDGIKEMLKNKQ